jgi:hypothetical protein
VNICFFKPAALGSIFVYYISPGKLAKKHLRGHLTVFIFEKISEMRVKCLTV